MYIPAHFAVTDSGKLAATMSRNSFAMLITQHEGAPFATHLPLLFTPDDKGRGTLSGHMARANPQWQDLARGDEALAVFTGPHGYISPSWYSQHPSVPTWNYVAVHAYGRARLYEDPQWLGALVRRLTAVYESGQPSPWQPDLPPDYERHMVAAIVGFEIAVTRLEGKYKLSQNRSSEDRQGVHFALTSSDSPDDQRLADCMAEEKLVEVE
jgi:transcriptional regulator